MDTQITTVYILSGKACLPYAILRLHCISKYMEMKDKKLKYKYLFIILFYHLDVLSLNKICCSLSLSFSLIYIIHQCWLSCLHKCNCIKCLNNRNHESVLNICQISFQSASSFCHTAMYLKAEPHFSIVYEL